MKKLFIAAAVIVMAGSMASCGQNPEGRPGYGRDGTGSDRAGRGCRDRSRNAGIRDSCRCRESENTTGAGK